MFKPVQCFFGGHIWPGWQWNPELRLEQRDCTRCRKREARDCQHEGQELVFVKQSERHAARNVGSAVCYQNYADRTFRCPRCGGDVTQSEARDFVGPSVLEGQTVHLMAMRAGPCGAAGDRVSEFVKWSGGEIGFAKDRVSVWMGCKPNEITLKISSGFGENGPSFYDTPGSSHPPSIANSTIDLLCKYVVTHKSAASISPARYRTSRAEASVPDKPVEQRDNHIRGRIIYVSAFPEHAPWLIEVTRTIRERFEARGATVGVELLESTVERRYAFIADVDVLLISARTAKVDYGQSMARQASMAYRIVPRKAWATAAGLRDVYGVLDECVIAYGPNTVNVYTVTPVIDAVDQVLAEITAKQQEHP